MTSSAFESGASVTVKIGDVSSLLMGSFSSAIRDEPVSTNIWRARRMAKVTARSRTLSVSFSSLDSGRVLDWMARQFSPDHDPIRLNRIMISSLCLSMISAQTRSAFVARENRFPPSDQVRGHAFPDHAKKRPRQVRYGFAHLAPSRVGYRSVKATSNELNTGLNIYRMIDFEPVWIWACNTIPGAIG